jgi:isopentenyl-diphosphate delta-isomerase
MPSTSEKRKTDHLSLCATDKVTFRNKTTLFEQMELIPRALPALRIQEVNTSTSIAGKPLAAPLWISAMTGGASDSGAINRELAFMAQELGIGFCLGSMRSMLSDSVRAADFLVRDAAPDALVMGNIGATEIARTGPEPVLEAIDKIGADGIGVHLNPMMELIQPGGDTDFTGVIDAIATLVEAAGDDLTVFVKETGCGLSWKDGEDLKKAGVKVVEVSGAGGTSWIGVETLRADGAQGRIGKTMWDWGIPTAVSTAWMADQGFSVISSGGIRSGLDIAKAVAMGARLTGVAAPLIQAREKGGIRLVREYLDDLIFGLKIAMVGCGAADLTELNSVPRVLGPDLSRWIETGWQER